MRPPVVPFFIAHGGCPHRCIFCDQEKIAGGGALPTPEEMLARIGEYGRTSGRPAVEAAFFGGSFTSLPVETQEALLFPLQPLLAAGRVSSVRLSTRPDSLDPSTARFLRRMGVKTVELGVQSMDDGVLDRAGRGHDSAAVVRAFSCLREEGLSVGAQLMPGLPGDSADKSIRSLRRVLDLAPDFIRIYPALVLVGTGLERLMARGEYEPLSLQEAVDLCKVMLHLAMTRGVPVIRIGLQPTSDLQKEGTILAGPWHSAFRQLVEAELCFDLMSLLLDADSREGLSVSLACHPSRVSDVIGQGGANRARILRERGVRVAEVRGDRDLGRHEIVLSLPGETRRGSLLEDLNYMKEDV